MFSAVYLVCVLNQPCAFFVDSEPYPTMEVCLAESREVMARNKARSLVGEFSEHTAEAQCFSWEKA